MKIAISILLSVFSCCALAVTSQIDEEAKIRAENKVVNFESIRRLLSQDFLQDSKGKREEKADSLKKEREEIELKTWDFPTESDFWPLFSEYWVVVNTNYLKWDFKTPEFGIREALETLLQEVGLYEIRFRILLTNTTSPAHMAMPSSPNDVFFILSVPFIRASGFSADEISLLLLEDWFRNKRDFLKNHLASEGVKPLIGANFKGKDFPKWFQPLDTSLKKFIADKGLGFNQQFLVTTDMETTLKTNSTRLQSYKDILRKMDVFLKDNVVYGGLLRMYPTPKMQIGWLGGK
jgi:hypothetical protein